MADIKLISYTELLKELEQSDESHLLLGNGFNNSLGIKTNYVNIVDKMIENYPQYEKVRHKLEGSGYDIEGLIGGLKESITGKDKDFLLPYIENKIKLDFMKATSDIVQKSIRDIYKEKNGEIHLLLKNFANYFTLNYDPFLYLLLLRFKKKGHDAQDNNALALQNTFKFRRDDLNARQNDIYNKIKRARDSGKLSVAIDNDSSAEELRRLGKTKFETIVALHFKHKEQWTQQDINIVCDVIWEEIKNKSVLDIKDGFVKDLFDEHQGLQNLYFLHGAFHIVQNGRRVKKITATENAAFCQRLEDAIHNEEQKIICVLASSRDEKEDQITNNDYLKKGFAALSKIEGSLVIFGSSLGENDKHIFEQINNSSIDHIYVSSCEEKKETDYKKASEAFQGKQLTLFDYNTVSYNTEAAA